MPKRLCLKCGALIPDTESFCRRHRRRSPRNPKRGTGWAAAKWAAKVLAAPGGRCSVRRCATPYDRVAAHHVVALADGGDPFGPGVALCHTHHEQATAKQRARRA